MDEPLPLPYCPYPDAADVAQHGVQPLPMTPPFVDFERARPHRSARHTAVPATQLTPAQVLQLAKVVGTSFARREPQCRHLQRQSVHRPGYDRRFTVIGSVHRRSARGTPRVSCTGSFACSCSPIRPALVTPLRSMPTRWPSRLLFSTLPVR